MREFIGLFVAFTLGALCVEVKSQREIAGLVRENGKLQVDVLGSYYDGRATCEKPTLVVRDFPGDVQEITIGSD